MKELGPCLNWVGTKTKAGYGQINRRQGGVKATYAHRVMYADSHGLSLDDLKGLVIRHRCDNPSCFHPGHLVVGTQADNMRDKAERKRVPYTPEIAARMSAGQRSRFENTPVSEETRRRQSESHMGHRHSAETRAKMSQAGRNRKASEETKERLRAAWVVRKAQKELACQ